MLRDTTMRVYRGKTLSDIGDYISNGSLQIRQFATILIHVGTNDVSNLWQHNNTVGAERRLYDFSFLQPRVPNDIVQGFIALVNLIRQFNSHAVVVFSAIIPRPKDHAVTDSIIRDVNAGIMQYCNKHCDNMIFYPTYKWFSQSGQPVSAYFAKKDKLHLTDLGSARLRQAFQTCLTDTTLAAQIGKIL